jgi:hypothetical protein
MSVEADGKSDQANIQKASLPLKLGRHDTMSGQ